MTSLADNLDPPVNNPNKKLKKIDKLKIGCWNANRLYGKIDLFKIFIKKKKPDIFGICELKSNSAELNFILQEINQFLKDNKIKPDVFLSAIRCSENLDELTATRYLQTLNQWQNSPNCSHDLNTWHSKQDTYKNPDFYLFIFWHGSHAISL